MRLRQSLVQYHIDDLECLPLPSHSNPFCCCYLSHRLPFLIGLLLCCISRALFRFITTLDKRIPKGTLIKALGIHKLERKSFSENKRSEGNMVTKVTKASIIKKLVIPKTTKSVWSPLPHWYSMNKTSSCG